MVKGDNLVSLVDRLRFLVLGRLWLQILVGMGLGVLMGVLVSPEGGGIFLQETSDLIVGWLSLPGHVFLALIRMIMVPLVVSSIILGVVGSGSLKELRDMGGKIIPYFLVSTSVAVFIGFSLSFLIRPGDYVDKDLLAGLSLSLVEFSGASDGDAGVRVWDRIVGLIPTNPLGAVLNESMLQLVIFAIFIGIALLTVKISRAKPLINLAKSVQELSMVIVGWAMLLVPIAVFGLLAQIVAKVGLSVLLGMSVYVFTVLLGLLLMICVYLFVIWAFTGILPFDFLRNIRREQLLAFSTSSSAAVMPLSIETAQKNFKVKPSFANFIIPLGATINMDGTAVYQVIAAVFLTQIFGIDLTMGQFLLLAVTTIGASIGTPSTPGVGIVVLATVLSGFGIPLEGVALIIGVDRVLDMVRTVVNVTGDLVACVVFGRRR